MDAANARKLPDISLVGEDRDVANADAAGRWQEIDASSAEAELYDSYAKTNACRFRNNIESYIGTISIPVGIAGPLKVHGSGGTTDYRVPLATTEATLVASYNRGAGLISAAGGCIARVVDFAVSRTPMFAFSDLTEAGIFSHFITDFADRLQEVVARTTAHGQLLGVRPVVEGNHVYLDMRFRTGDASGQNMVTFAADAICSEIHRCSPVTPRYWFLEANFSGDKKAAGMNLGSVRGKRVCAEVLIGKSLLESLLHTTPQQMVDYWYAGAIGGVMSATTGIHGHIANGLAAFYLACGQDVACVAESAVGVTRLELTTNGDLYSSVTLPNIMVGTVGGGTGLPSAAACLEILGLPGAGNSVSLAEVCAALVLGGELSIIGAFCSGDFATAHRSLSRGEPQNGRRKQ